MRVTTLQTNNTMMNYVSSAESRYYELSQEASSGKKVTKPSDDPTAAKSILNINSQLSQLNSYLSNMSTAQNELDTLDSSLSNLTTLIGKATDLTTEAANGTYSSSDLKNMKTQVDQIIQSVTDTANTNYNGTYIFSGTSTSTPAYTTAASGSITYGGDSGTRTVTISDGTSVVINTPGNTVFGSYNSVTAAPVTAPTVPGDVAGTTSSTTTDAAGNITTVITTKVLSGTNTITTTTTGTGTGLLGTLMALSTSLGTDNQKDVGSCLTGLNTALDTVSTTRTQFAAVSNRFSMTKDSINSTVTSLTGYKSDLQNADLATVLADLAAQQTALQATLSTTSSLLNGKTLLNYI